jgi:RsiW-degrading membrane proteinase PrsW (M82 family)
METSIISIMFVVYLAILALNLKKVLTMRRFLLIIIPLGVAFGMIAYAVVVAPLNSIEAQFMNNGGLLHILLVAPIQEESAKFTCFLLAYSLLIRGLRASSEELSEIRKSRILVVLGASVGLAFAVLENLIDYGNLAAVGTLRRTLISWPIHMLTISISAYGFGRYRKTREIKVVSGLFLWAVLIHVIFNEIAIIIM